MPFSTGNERPSRHTSARAAPDAVLNCARTFPSEEFTAISHSAPFHFFTTAEMESLSRRSFAGPDSIFGGAAGTRDSAVSTS